MEDAQTVAAIREFNRFYTNVIGVLRSGLLSSPFSLTEARVLFELGGRESIKVSDLRRTLDIDAGYLSRILGRFESQGLAVRKNSSTRRRDIGLTPQGREAFALIDERSSEQNAALIEKLDASDRRRLVGAMATIRALLETPGERDSFVLRSPEPGDLGWVVQRHGAVYSSEYGWNETFEALVARIVADYVDQRDPARECAWIAEIDGEAAGCVFCVNKDENVAQLRLLLVDPRARGLGIGARLVDQCIRFARRAGYRELVLWTNDVLESARRIYEGAGFELVAEDRHHSFGHDLVGQNWSLDLRTSSAGSAAAGRARRAAHRRAD